MSLFTFNIHTDNSEVLHEIKQLKKFIMSELSDFRDLATRQGAAITGIVADIKFLKDKLAANTGGIDAAGVAELRTLFQANAEALEALDQETDSTSTEPTP